MATLTGATVASSYGLLLKVDATGIDTSTPRTIQDGLARSSALKLAGSAVQIKQADDSAATLEVTGTSTLTGAVTATGGVVGALTGNASTATALETARTIGGTSFDGTANIVPATITVADTTNATCSVSLFESATGDLAPKSDGGLTYAADTGTLTATAVVGALTGNVTGDLTGDVTAGALADGVTATTQTAGDDSTKVATTAYADNASTSTGKVLQVVAGTPVTAVTFSSDATSMADITGLTATITPSSTDSKILIQVMLTFGTSTTNHVGFGIKRGTTQIGSSTTATGSRQNAITSAQVDNEDRATFVFMQYMDSPSTTSATTYQATLSNRSEMDNTTQLNTSRNDADADYTFHGTSSVTLMEVAG